ncbi:Thioredoxin [Gracilaria domingensis]|nr:Thioredoxin [Gracilaria domingensis]
MSRRQALQLSSGALGFATLGVLFRLKEQFRLISPKALLSSLGLPQAPIRSGVQPALAIDEQSQQYQEAFQYIQRIDSRPPISCPDFPRSSDWINSRPLSFSKELKGKLVLCDFFTYCCVNCQHVLPKLRQLETKYGEDGSGGLTVVGVHSAKFTAERDTANVAAAVERYDVRHPVVNDERMSLWNGLGVSSWPTLALVGPRGNLLAVWAGERQENDIDVVIAAALEYYGSIIDHRPLPPAPKRSALLKRPSESPLRYPGKLAFSANGDRLYVSDSGNNRILEVDTQSRRVLRVFGSGEASLIDSDDPLKAAFHSPQGLAESDGILYVADTESHAVRAVDLRSGSVTTIGGNGEQGFDYAGGKVGKLQSLSSPWDVELVGDSLFVAMAGTHQIWSLELPSVGKNRSVTSTWQVFSGTGRELEKNSPNGRLAAWAQPSHLSATSKGLMYVADSESSSVRGIEIQDQLHPTKTIAGGDGLIAENLFAYGDREGRGATARFQHPLAVCYDEKRDLIYVADSYNHRIKAVDTSGFAKVLCGSGTPGMRDGIGKEAMFWEPSGLALSPKGDELYVSDTNNFAVRVVNIENNTVSTMSFASAIPTPDVQNLGKPLIPYRRRAVQISCDPATPKSTVSFAIGLPDRSHFTPGTLSRYQVNLQNEQIERGLEAGVTIMNSGVVKQNGKYGSFAVDLSDYSVPLTALDIVEVEVVTYYCTDDDETCRTEADIFKIPLSNEAPSTYQVAHTIVPRKPMSALRA